MCAAPTSTRNVEDTNNEHESSVKQCCEGIVSEPIDRAALTHAAVKLALSRPMQASVDQALRMVTHIPHMGPAVVPARSGKRGRPVTRTQYDDAVDRRREHYQRLVRLPSFARLEAMRRSLLSDPTYVATLRAVCRDPDVMGSRAREVLRRRAEAGISAKNEPDESTVRRHIRLIQREDQN